MVEHITRMRAPFYVQFELTERCNNRCFFCYNPLAKMSGKEMDTSQIKKILKQLRDVGVFRINFNGGEPLARADLREIIEFAAEQGFQLHMNTNSTLVTDEIADFVSQHMKSVCTSVLHSQKAVHDKMTGRIGAFDDMVRGVRIWRKHGVNVEVNVCTSTENYLDIINIGQLCSDLDCYSLCSTRYILNAPENQRLLLNAEQTVTLIDELLEVKERFPKVADVSLPGPVPYCEIPESYHEKLRALNVPCQYAYGLARISPTGKVTPCTISSDVIGDLNFETFASVWHGAGWKKYEDLCHIPYACRDCENLKVCRGGCVVYDESMRQCGLELHTRKWSI